VAEVLLVVEVYSWLVVALECPLSEFRILEVLAR